MAEIKFWLAVAYRIRFFLITFTYLVGFAALEIRFVFVLVPMLGLGAFIYTCDQKREQQGMDDFRGDWLFFRYGEEVRRTYFSIPVKPEWQEDETREFANSLRQKLAQRLRQELPVAGVEILDNLVVSDMETGEQKTFLRLSMRSKSGSRLTHFVHYASFGHTITAHYFTYIRGTHSDWDLFKFVYASPCTIWFWGLRWLLNQYSVLVSMSNLRASSFEGLDIRTMYCLTNYTLLTETEQLIEEAGFMTDDIRQILHMSITQNNHQHVSIENSPNASVGNVAQSPLMKAAKGAI